MTVAGAIGNRSIMEQTHPPLWRRLHTTPLRDLLRGRVSGRLDWRARIARAGLPGEVSEVITRVVRRARLWRIERAAVAEELIAHFGDGLRAGRTAEQLIAEFGDPVAAARLIGRAKRRGRPVAIRAAMWGVRAAFIAAVVFTLFLIRFLIGQPTPTVDYAAKMIAASRAIPLSDSAWPVYAELDRQIEAAGIPTTGLTRTLLDASQFGHQWPAIAAWVHGHPQIIETARRAAAIPKLGFQVDVQLYWTSLAQTLLGADAKAAIEAGEGVRAAEDFEAIYAISRQRTTLPVSRWSQELNLGDIQFLADRLARGLVVNAAIIPESSLVGFAHMLAGPQVAADLIDTRVMRDDFADVIQHVYTDDGHGDGRITPAALPVALERVDLPAYPLPSVLYRVMLMASPSRLQISAAFNQYMDMVDSNYQKPMREVDWSAAARLRHSWSVKARPYAPAWWLLHHAAEPDPQGEQEAVEMTLGGRDGALIGIVLELYRRHHDRYPTTLAELSPEFLPVVPVGRLTGEPLKLVYQDGRPVVTFAARAGPRTEQSTGRKTVDWPLYPPLQFPDD